MLYGEEKMKRIALVVTLCALTAFTSCVTAPTKYFAPEEVENEHTQRAKIVRYAESLLGMRDISQLNRWFRNDCSGYVLGVYHSLGYDVRLVRAPNSSILSRALYHSLHTSGMTYSSGIPKPADVVFFQGTIDEAKDKISHVGIVANTLADGTVRILNYTSQGVTELKMNLSFPSTYRDASGFVLNDFLKKKSPESENEKLLSGELFYSYGDVLGYTKRRR
jgi:hypothetical protein